MNMWSFNIIVLCCVFINEHESSVWLYCYFPTTLPHTYVCLLVHTYICMQDSLCVCVWACMRVCAHWKGLHLPSFILITSCCKITSLLVTSNHTVVHPLCYVYTHSWIGKTCTTHDSTPDACQCHFVGLVVPQHWEHPHSVPAVSRTQIEGLLFIRLGKTGVQGH